MHHTRLRNELALALGLALLGPVSAAASDPPPDRPTPIVVRVDDGGFGWADAGVGALAGVGGTLAVVGGAALVRAARPDVTRSEKGVRL